MESHRKRSIVFIMISALPFAAVTGCEWSNWENISECDVNPLLCLGDRTDSRSCSGMSDEVRTIPCEGRCKPCTAWSEWSQPCRQVRSWEGQQRRSRHCFFSLCKKQREFEYRPAVCARCPWCEHGAGYDCTYH